MAQNDTIDLRDIGSGQVGLDMPIKKDQVVVAGSTREGDVESVSDR